jgi:hypothetical protein
VHPTSQLLFSPVANSATPISPFQSLQRLDEKGLIISNVLRLELRTASNTSDNDELKPHCSAEVNDVALSRRVEGYCCSSAEILWWAASLVNYRQLFKEYIAWADQDSRDEVEMNRLPQLSVVSAQGWSTTVTTCSFHECTISTPFPRVPPANIQSAELIGDTESSGGNGYRNICNITRPCSTQHRFLTGESCGIVKLSHLFPMNNRSSTHLLNIGQTVKKTACGATGTTARFPLRVNLRFRLNLVGYRNETPHQSPLDQLRKWGNISSMPRCVSSSTIDATKLSTILL